MSVKGSGLTLQSQRRTGLIASERARVLDELRSRGVSLNGNATLHQIATAVTRITGIRYTGDPAKIWAAMRPFYEKAQCSLPPMKPLDVSRYRAVQAEIDRRRLDGESVAA